MTSGAALVNAAEVLGTRLDAELLLAHVLDLSRSAVLARDERVLTPEEQGDFENLLARRVAGEPLAYLTGTKEFWSLELEVSKDVLVPRPETELLVQWGLELDRNLMLDIGTGSGAIALALARELPHARVSATDISPAALKVARANASRLAIGNVEFHQADLFAEGDSRYDLIVSNPPYVAEADPHLADLTFEPRGALIAGEDGLSVLRRIVSGAAKHLAQDGWLLVEHGATQGPEVRKLFKRAKFTAVETRRDLAGLERVTGGQRQIVRRP